MLSNKVALITGAAQGIGLAISKTLLKNGAKVSLLDVRDDVGLETCKRLQMEYSPERVTFIHCDVTCKDDLRSAFVKTLDTFGGLDIVCNNAGIADETNWKKMIDINLVAVIEGTYLAVEFMSTQQGYKGGDVINIASLGGLVPIPYSAVYCASKHGVVGFTRSLKDRLPSDGVRINALCPEFVDTAMARQSLGELSSGFMADKRLISPDTVGKAFLQLLLKDTDKVGAAMMVKPPEKISYFIFPGEQRPEMAKL